MPKRKSCDASEIVQILSEALHRKFPKIDQSKFVIVIGDALEQSSEPRLSLENVSSLMAVRNNLHKQKITLGRILESKLPLLEIQRVVKLYDILQTTEPDTLDHLEISDRIESMLLSFDMRDDLDGPYPTMDKIKSANVTYLQRVKLVELYNIWKTYTFHSMEWYEIRRQINDILENQMSSLEDVQQLEQKPNIRSQISKLEAPMCIKSILYSIHFKTMTSNSEDARFSEWKDKLDLAIQLPYSKMVPFVNNTKEFCIRAANILNAELYGMEKVKERVLQCLNDRIHNPHSRSILCLKGKPGVGKTRLAKTIAKAVGLPFDRISLGGLDDVKVLKGSDTVWKGAGPSAILHILARVKCANPVILLDEVDKMSHETQHALLHILDPTTNAQFQDLYLNEFNHDISNVWFIPVINDDSALDGALKDRLNIIEVPSYTHSELVHIMQLHILPATLVDKGLNRSDVTIDQMAAMSLLSHLNQDVKDSGVRPVERILDDLVSKLSLLESLGTHSPLLTFKLPGFTGFPYCITLDTISQMVPKADQNYSGMYI